MLCLPPPPRKSYVEFNFTARKNKYSWIHEKKISKNVIIYTVQESASYTENCNSPKYNVIMKLNDIADNLKYTKNTSTSKSKIKTLVLKLNHLLLVKKITKG